MTGNSPTAQGSDDLALLFWDNDDFYVDEDGQMDYCGRNPHVTAYTVNRQTDDGAKYGVSHMCDKGWDYPALSDCPSICANIDTVGHGMSLMATILIHEWTHFDRIGMAALDVKEHPTLPPNTHIKDVDGGYGAFNCAHLPKEEGLINADSYRWFVAETFFFAACGKKPFKDAPDPGRSLGPDPFNDESLNLPDRCARPLKQLSHGSRRRRSVV